MKETKYTTLATSQTLEGINKIVNEYFYSNIEINKSSLITGNKCEFYELHNKKGKLNSFKIMKDKNYKFLQTI